MQNRTPSAGRLYKKPVCGSLIIPGLAAAATLFMLSGCRETDREDVKTEPPLVLDSSTDLGCVVSESEPAFRLVRVRNSTETVLHVSRWSVSCECLEIEPPSIDLQPGGSSYVRLVFDPAKEGNEFVGDLLISVDALSNDVRVGTFTVPVSVVAPDVVDHLAGER